MAERGDGAARQGAPEVVVPVDAVNEQVILAAAMVDAAARADLVMRLQPDHFFVDAHKAAWAGIQEMERRKLAYDPATLQSIAGDRVNVAYLGQLAGLRPEMPSNLNHHVEMMRWDRVRASAASGPLSLLLEAVRNPKEAPERVRALARHVGQAFAGSGSRLVHDSATLIAEHIREVERRVEGHETWPYGIPGLDNYEGSSRRRMIPGAAPGMVTVVTGVSGSGKSALIAHMALGLAKQRRKVTYGAWEMSGGVTLELLACISLGWSRSDLMEGRLTRDHVKLLRERMEVISRWVVFAPNPFRRARGEKRSNERNLDMIAAIIAETGCEVFIADLWKRCLADASPEAEEDALSQQQAMFEDMRVHGILAQQQRLKDVEQRANKQPTRDGVKGSSMWVEMADSMIGTHRPGQWKSIPDDKLQGIILKQRYAPWPLAVEFEWNGEKGSIAGGTSIDVRMQGEADEFEQQLGGAHFPVKRGRA